MADKGAALNGTVIWIWRGIVVSVIAAGILGGVNAGQNLAATASILQEVQRRLDDHSERIRYLERNTSWQP